MNASTNTTNTTRTRNSKGRFAKKATVADVTDVMPDDEAVIDEAIINDPDDRIFNERFTAFKEMFGFTDPLPTARYPILGFITNLLVCAVGGYAAGIFATYVGVAALVMSGSAFIGVCAYIISMVIGCLSAMRAGAVAGKYVAYGKFEDDYQAAKGWVKGKLSNFKLGNPFNRNKVEV